MVVVSAFVAFLAFVLKEESINVSVNQIWLGKISFEDELTIPTQSSNKGSGLSNVTVTLSLSWQKHVSMQSFAGTAVGGLVVGGTGVGGLVVGGTGVGGLVVGGTGVGGLVVGGTVLGSPVGSPS
jgi:hypothetical protein